MSAGIKKTF